MSGPAQLVASRRVSLCADKLVFFPSGPRLPDGWLNAYDAKLLYHLSSIARGPILEIGSWIGRSTCCLAYAQRDRANRVPLDVVDYGLTGVAEWRHRFPSQDPFMVRSAERILKVLLSPGGTPGLLKQNLVERDLAQYVRSLFFGDVSNFASKDSYRLIFADVTHSVAEIDKNLPIVLSLLDRDDFLVAFDDVHEVETADLVRAYLTADYFALSKDLSAGGKILVCAKGPSATEFLRFCSK